MRLVPRSAALQLGVCFLGHRLPRAPASRISHAYRSPIEAALLALTGAGVGGGGSKGMRRVEAERVLRWRRRLQFRPVLLWKDPEAVKVQWLWR
jgi:hypothetical protein